MITFNNETTFSLQNEKRISSWIQSIIISEGYSVGKINYIFCDDSYLHKINMKHLNHDTYTDVISFDYSGGKAIDGDIYISIERVRDNSKIYKVSFTNELSRVMIHGVLHFLGFNDKTKQEKALMRNKEDFYINVLNT